MTLALACCAFVLSFDALRSLAVTLGLPTSIAWLWPCAIDMAIAQATLCLLSLNRRAGPLATKTFAVQTATASELEHDEPAQPRPPRDERRAGGTSATSDLHGSSVRALDVDKADSATAMVSSIATADIERWQPLAESIVREGVTTKDARLVAIILAQREAGVPPSTIGRHHRVHHTTIGRILSAAATLTT